MKAMTLASLMVVFLLSTGALFWPGYKENWLQFFGLSTMAGTSVLAAMLVMSEGVSPILSMLSVGIALYMLGVAVRIIKFELRGRRQKS